MPHEWRVLVEFKHAHVSGHVSGHVSVRGHTNDNDNDNDNANVHDNAAGRALLTYSPRGARTLGLQTRSRRPTEAAHARLLVSQQLSQLKQA